jgi:non-ribosomal peptide synthetase component F
VVVGRLAVENQTSHFDLMMYVGDRKREMVVSLQYNTDLFDHSTISRMLRHFEFILRAFAADPGRRLLDVSQALEDEGGASPESISPANMLKQEQFIF